MTDYKDLICKDFENEIGLYMEQSLPQERMKFWDKHVEPCSKCSALIRSEKSLLETCKDELAEDILDSKFDMMINMAVKPKSKLTLKQMLYYKKEYSIKTKFAVISGLAVVAIVVSLITPRQNPVKTVSSELLDWEGTKIDSQIESLQDKIEVINNDEWSNQLKIIDERLQLLEKQADKF